MIPRKLRLRNFMSYGDPGAELDFNFRTACLTGNNGEGKSALLDAITWALWGKARSDRLAAEDVIRSAPGKDQPEEAQVEFEFESSGAVYQVNRKRHRRRGASLDLLARDPATGDLRPLTGHTQKDTQTVINDLLRMDYETFLNSSFLAQGRADEFSRQSPAKRKELLGEMLDLRRYQEMQDRSRERQRKASSDAEHEKPEIARIERELENEPAERARLADLEAQAARAQAEAQAAQQALDSARAALAQLEQDAARLDRLRSEKQRLAADLQRLQSQTESFAGRIADHRRTIARKDEIACGLRDLENARGLLAELDAGQQAAAKLELDRTAAAHQVELALQRLQSDLRAADKRLAELNLQAAAIAALEAQQRQLSSRIEALEKAAEQADQIAAHISAAREQLAALAAHEKQTAGQRALLEQKLQLLGHSGAACPLCKQALDEDARARLLGEMNQERNSLASDYRHTEASRALLSRDNAAEQQKHTGLLAQARELAAAHRQSGDLQGRLAAARDAQQQAAALAARRDELKTAIQSGDFAPEARARAGSLERQVRELQYDPAAHQQARDRAASLAPFERDSQQLTAAEQALPQDTAHLAELQTALNSAQQTAASVESEQAGLEQRITILPGLRAQVQDLSRRGENAQQNMTVAVAELAACRQRLQTLAQLAAELKQRRCTLRAAERDAVLWSELALAFGKDGIQALVIENIVPQLEEQANELLDRLTEGRMKLAVRTEKTLKSSRETAETLEITVADELGERKYESYSGGEAFRIDFALRIALARLLASRSGAKLQTLIIDEGFGTQDAAARDRLIEAILAIQQDFEKIIVVTHVEEMKDAFEHRILVTKSPSGSHLQQVSA